MTVIAYKAGRMACDSLCADTVSGSVCYKANKIFRMKSGALVGCSGAADARAILALLENVKRGNQIPTAAQICAARVETENGVLIALPNGELWCITCVLSEDTKEWHADCCQITGMGGMAVAGCGGEVAMAAMKAGRSAREAVAIACEMNAFCRPPIYEFGLHEASPAKARKTRK